MGVIVSRHNELWFETDADSFLSRKMVRLWIFFGESIRSAGESMNLKRHHQGETPFIAKGEKAG